MDDLAPEQLINMNLFVDLIGRKSQESHTFSPLSASTGRGDVFAGELNFSSPLAPG